MPVKRRIKKMPSFRGTSKILIQPNSFSIGFRFHCTTCTSTTSNDGMIPWGTTISSVVVTAKTADGTAETGLIESTTLTTPDIDLALSWPTNGAGRYKLTFVLTLSNGTLLELDFHRVDAQDL